VGRFVQARVYQRTLALELVDRARGRSWSWDARRLAVLMLEQQLLKLASHEADEQQFWLTTLGIADPQHASASVRSTVRKEGYSTTTTAALVLELRRRLQTL